MPYKTQDLLDNLYVKLDARNKSKNEKKKLVKPIVTRMFQFINISNFPEICENINRSAEDIIAFIQDELRVRTSINAQNVLTIRRKYTQKQLESIFNNYINEKVKCNECNSFNTELTKYKDFSKISCKLCFSSRIIS